MTTELEKETDRHIDSCDVCGDGPGVCLTGYLLAVNERAGDEA